MYQIERQDQLYKTLPRALFFSPTIVVFSALHLLLPFSGVFAPGSLTITTKNYTDFGPCMIPTGNLSPNTTDSTSLNRTGPSGIFFGATPWIMALTTQWFGAHRIPDLPQACGPNCRYKVHVPSFVFQCTPNPSSLPYAQGGIPPVDPLNPKTITLWNMTLDPQAISWVFYIAWRSNGRNGTSGNASCLSVHAQYDVEVRIIATLSLILLNVD